MTTALSDRSAVATGCFWLGGQKCVLLTATTGMPGVDDDAARRDAQKGRPTNLGDHRGADLRGRPLTQP